MDRLPAGISEQKKAPRERRFLSSELQPLFGHALHHAWPADAIGLLDQRLDVRPGLDRLVFGGIVWPLAGRQAFDDRRRVRVEEEGQGNTRARAGVEIRGAMEARHVIAVGPAREEI